MRSLLSALCVFLLSCTPPSAAEQAPDRTAATVAISPASAVACAAALKRLRPVSASFELLPHRIANQILFGLDGAFVASSGSYPLGASRRWWELDAAAATIREIDFETPYGRIQQSPDGAQFLFSAIDVPTGGFATYVRDTIGGVPRVLALGDVVVDAWIGADDVLLERRDEMGVYHLINTRSLVDTIVFRSPAPPSVAAAGDDEWFSLSGDLRWAVFTRWQADDSLARIDLFDVRRQTYAPEPLPVQRSWLVPCGDVLVWLDGTELRAMHLCDRRAVTLATLPKIASVMEGGLRFSANGRYLSFAYGHTDELTAPERDVIVDLDRGTIADIAAPWGFVRQWSPGLDVVVLSRYGYHTSVDKLARFLIR